MVWRRLITQVLRHQSQSGTAKHLLTRNYLSANKFQDCTRNRFFFSQQRSQSSYLGNLTRRLRDLSEAREAYYLKKLSDDPEAVIRAYASRPSMHTNSLAVSEYVKAFVQVDLKSSRRDSYKSAREKKSIIINILRRICESVLICLWILITLVGNFGWIFVTMFDEQKEEEQPILETNTKFSDVEGVDDEAIAELEEIVDYIRNREEYTHLGGKLPKCVLLCGPSSTDKTMLAKAIAGEAGVPFFQSSGVKLVEISKFDEKNDGVGAQRVRDLFAAAKKQSPCIIFIDDINAIGGNQNRKRQTLNQMFVELDGFKQNEGILVIGATDYPEYLAKALATPGRFDRHVVIDKSRRAMANFGISCVEGSKDR